MPPPSDFMTIPSILRNKTYKHEVNAEAHFYTTDCGNRSSIRLILPSVGLEFSDGHFIGLDPQGLLCYDNFSDFPRDIWSRYEGKSMTHDGKIYVNIKFFARNGRDVFAEFFALDRENLGEKSGVVNKVRDGRWTEVDFGSTIARVRKSKDKGKVTITVQAINLEARFDVDAELRSQELDVTGRLRFKDEAKIGLGALVRWDSDHLVFYESERNSRDYTAYFMPSYDPDTAVTMLGSVDKVFENVKWSATRQPVGA